VSVQLYALPPYHCSAGISGAVFCVVAIHWKSSQVVLCHFESMAILVCRHWIQVHIHHDQVHLAVWWHRSCTRPSLASPGSSKFTCAVMKTEQETAWEQGYFLTVILLWVGVFNQELW